MFRRDPRTIKKYGANLQSCNGRADKGKIWKKSGVSHPVISLIKREIHRTPLQTSKQAFEAMDHSPIRQTFEFEKSISTAGKSILDFMQLSSLVAKYCKMWKIWPRKVFEFCILLYYARKSVTTMWKCGNAFSRVIQKYTKFANFTLLYF